MCVEKLGSRGEDDDEMELVELGESSSSCVGVGGVDSVQVGSLLLVDGAVFRVQMHVPSIG